MATVKELAADARYARIGKKYGLENSLRALWEGRRAGISPSLSLAMLEQESGGKNVFGHDPTIFIGAGTVTKSKYLAYRNARRASGNRRMQGVGPLQLTWWEFQDGADRLGGAWIPKYNLRYGYQRLAASIKSNGKREGIKRYNGSGAAAEAYVKSVLAREAKWHKRLHGS